jgi:AraC-like DNA-binding protein
VAEGLQFEMRGSAGHFELVFDILPSIQQPSPQAIKSVVSGCLSFMRWVTRSDIHPTHVNLTEEMPLDLDAYEQLFTCPINFSGKENSLFFLKKDMLEPLVTSDDQLSDIHDQNLQVYRDRIKVQTFADKVKAILMEQLPSGEPKQETIAKLLHVSASTLKRRLKEEDVTYKSLLDETRPPLSLKYLVQESLSLTEITYLLGFSQSSAFTRAFKRWQGVSPKIFVQNNS